MERDYDIIAVDDDTIEHEIMTRALRNTSYQIKCFEYVDDAFDFLAMQHPRFLFVDYRMPNCSGMEFIERLASTISLDNINVYLTSNSTVPEAVLTQARTLGVNFILKEVVSSKDYLANLCAQDGNTTS